MNFIIDFFVRSTSSFKKGVKFSVNTKPNSVSLLGYDIFEKELSSLSFEDKTLISTINQYSYCIAEEDKAFKKALRHSDVLLPDGIGIVWAARLLHRKRIKKIAGADIHDFLLKKLNNESGSCFYLGSSNETLKKIEDRIGKDYPNIKFTSFSPPFTPVFSEKDNTAMISRINQVKPDVLFVGMTAPKQEKWSFQNKNELNVKTICSIGAVFDFYAGTVKRPNAIWIKYGLEWFGRLLKEPRRMWKRYIYYGAVYTFHLIKKIK